jgi:hypothetical protein
MLVEGKGLVAPAPAPITVPRNVYAYYVEQAQRRRSFQRYAQRADAWGRGLTTSPELTGFLGHWAFCNYLNRRMGTSLAPDMVPRRGGDGGVDIVIGNVTIQVKTRVTSRRNLIRRVDAAKKMRGLVCKLFAFARWEPEQMRVSLLGWSEALSVLDVGRLRKSPRANHFNLDVGDEHLESVARLPDWVRARSGA